MRRGLVAIAVAAGCTLTAPPDEDIVGSCNDGIRNGGEADADCGGPCPKCGDGHRCATGGDCLSGACERGACAVPSCDDGVENGSESDVDCGAECPTQCGTGKTCFDGADCQSGVCSDTTGACG